jgi:hypothetical protein
MRPSAASFAGALRVSFCLSLLLGALATPALDCGGNNCSSAVAKVHTGPCASTLPHVANLEIPDHPRHRPPHLPESPPQPELPCEDPTEPTPAEPEPMPTPQALEQQPADEFDPDGLSERGY